MSYNTKKQVTGTVVMSIAAFASVFLWHDSSASDSAEVMLKEVLVINADPDYGEYLASECMTCHSAEQSDSNIPVIHGKEAIYLATALLEYKNQTRESDTMRSVASALGADEIAALVAYFGRQ